MKVLNWCFNVIVWGVIAAAIAMMVLLLCAEVCRADGYNVRKTVMTVDQDGNMNVAGVASVSDVATNAVKVQIAQAAADAANITAQGVTNALEGIVANIMSNNVVIYRSGYSDSFAGLVIVTDEDTFLISDFTKVSLVSGTLTTRIGYVCTADIGTVKPVVFTHDTLVGGRENFIQVADANVTTPIIHNESRTIAGTTYSKWYEITITQAVVGTAPQYFYFINVDGDVPGGDGATLELPNGVTGGTTGSYTWGDKRMEFVGGLLTGAYDAN